MKPLLKATITTKIYFYDVDAMQVVWHGNYPRFLEIARSALMDKLDYNYSQMVESGYMWPIIDMRLKYVRPIVLNQTIIVEAELIEFENRLVVNYHIYDETTNVVLTKATTIQVAVKIGNTSMELESPKEFIERVHGALK